MTVPSPSGGQVSVTDATPRFVATRVVVPDANVLIRDTIRYARTGRATVLNDILRRHGDSVAVWVPPSVIDEVHKHLPTVAARSNNSERSLEVFDTEYVPFLHIGTADDSDSMTTAESDLQHRDPDDVPILRLALALDAVLLSKDRDLTDGGAAVSEWLDVLFAIRTTTTIEQAFVLAVSMLAALPRRLQGAGLLGVAYLVFASHPQANKLRHATKNLAVSLATTYATSASVAANGKVRGRLAPAGTPSDLWMMA